MSLFGLAGSDPLSERARFLLTALRQANLVEIASTVPMMLS